MKRTAIVLCVGIAAPGCIPHCDNPSDCIGGNVCAEDGECRAPNELVTARITWTIAGAPASTMTCPTASLRIGFVTGYDRYGDPDELVYAPVPCAEGVFSISNLPSYQQVELGYDTGDSFAHGQFADSNGDGGAAFDLPASD